MVKMYLYDRGWKPWEIAELPMMEALTIYQGIQQGLYGPLANQSVNMQVIHYLHYTLWANEKPNKRPKPPSFEEMNPQLWQHLTGHIPKPEADWKKDIIKQFKKNKKERSSEH